MSDVATAVRRLQIETTVKGASEATAQLGQLNASYQDNAKAAATAEKAGGQYETRLIAMQRQCDAMARAQLAQNAAFAAQAAAVSTSSNAMVAANDNTAKSFTFAGLEAAEMANHLRLAGEAAYAFSPAFRGVVNGLAAPALRGASVALVAVAGGVVTATNLIGSGLVRVGAAAASASTSLTPVAGVITSAGVAMQAFNPSIAAVASSILTRFAPALRLLGAVGLVVNAAKMVGDAWELGGQQLESYRQIAEQAAKVDLSTTYFQRLTKGAEDSKVSVASLTTALTTLQRQSADQLGGSALQNRLNASVKAGNFAGNTGVQEYAQANTTQQRYEAIVSLINQAMTAGQRLAALDIAGTAFGPEAADNLRKDSEYFDKLKAAAASVADTKLVSPEDVGRALDLQRRYDAAVAILETRWHPIQDLLTKAGVEFHANWVATVETIAQGVDWATKLIAKLGDAPAWFQKKLNEGSQWIVDNTTTPESRKAAETSYGISSDPVEMAKGTDAYAVAVNKLRAGLQDQAEQQRKVAEANTIAQKTLGDTSKEIDVQKKKVDDSSDAYDRALESVTKHTARLQADTLAIGLGAGALEEYRARTQLTMAAQLAGREPTAALTAEIEKQAKAAGEAGRALALARAQSQANFTSQTLFMSQADLAAANVMHNLYGDEWQSHMDDALAKQIKMNSLIADARGETQQFTGDLVKGLMSGKGLMEALGNAAQNLSNKMADKSLESLFSGDLLSAGIQGTVALVSGVFASDQKAKQQLEAAREEWKKAGPAFSKFLTEMTGGVQGNLSQQFSQALNSYNDLATKADKAGDTGAVRRLQAAYGEGLGRLAHDFVTTFQATLEGMADGLGPNSPFLNAVNNVKAQLATAQGFVDDAKSAYQVLNGIDPNAAYIAGSSGASTMTAAQAAAVQTEVDKANQAASAYLLSLLQTAPELSTVQTAMLNVKGTSTALQGALEQLGMSSQDAAAAISSGVTKAIAQLRATFEDGLTSRLNTANGAGYLNDAAALIKQHQQDLADASAVGASASLVSAVFAAEAQKIVDDAGLIGDSFTDFITLFPQFNGVVGQSATALKAASDKIQAFVKSLNDYLNGLKVGPNSTLSPQAQLEAAQSTFNAQLALARNGNQDALGTITQYATTLLEQAKSFYASSGGYSAIYDQVTAALQALPANLGVVDNSTKIVAAINDTAAQSQALLNAQTLLMTTSNSLEASQVSLANSQVGILSSINSLQSTASAQLALLNQQYASQPFTADTYGVVTVVDNTMLQALNKIVFNTYAISMNTLRVNRDMGGRLATGGYVTGPGTGTSDSIPMWLSNGEGVINAAMMARLGGREGIDNINAGRVPALPVAVPFRAANDDQRRPGNDNREAREIARALAQSSRADADRIIAKLDELLGALDSAPAKTKDAFRQIVATSKPRAAG